MERFSRAIDKIIQQAMEEGRFDNLPGKGKPLKLDDNPHLDQEWQLAYHMLKENGFAPEFIEKRQEIEMLLAKAREVLMRTWLWRAGALDSGEDEEMVATEWAKAQKIFDETIEGLNKKIRDYNLIVPTPSVARAPIDYDKEMAMFK
jgi:DnaJ family protein C protein 28